MAEIYQFLLSLGVTPNYVGFHYTAYALSLCLENPKRLVYVTKELYPDVAQEFKTTPDCVERNIRTAVQVAWKKHEDLLIQLSKHVWTGRPAVSEFLSVSAAYFLYECEGK